MEPHMAIAFERDITQDLEAALQREWIETNGLGGWAASTLCGAHTRRYHGLLDAVEGALFTPYGLRSLAPSHPDYRGWYGGRVGPGRGLPPGYRLGLAPGALSDGPGTGPG